MKTKNKKPIIKISVGAELILSFRNRAFTDRKKKAQKEACRKGKYGIDKTGSFMLV